MENDSKMDKDQNENILVYPPIKAIIDNSESKKFLSLFSKKLNNKISSDKFDSNNSQKNSELIKEKNPNPDNVNDEIFLLNKGIEQEKTKSKRTGDVISALENFLRKSDLIQKIIKFFEENNREKSKHRKEKKNQIDEEKEKLTEIHIKSLISKLADNVGIERYKKNEFVVKMNEIGDNCYFLLSGRLSILKPVEYHIELTYDEYMQYIKDLMKYKEYYIIDNVRRINQSFIDIGLVEDLDKFIKSYFIIKLKKDITRLIKTGKFTKEFIENRFKLFNLSYEDYNLNAENINNHILLENQVLKSCKILFHHHHQYLQLLSFYYKDY